ncbi:MAG: hypothetical protein H6706_04925 [Myxococcales bacterium]|nr:hypothetical protein [Myxococcales bacterium]
MISLLDPEERIEGRIGVHDRRSFELKLDYSIDPERPVNRYAVDAFLFLPRSLGIHKDTYDYHRFYADVQAYIRFKTPPSTLATLADLGAAEAPLVHLRWLIAELSRGGASGARRALRQALRLVGCQLRWALRREMGALLEALDEPGPAAPAAEALVSTLATFLDRFRALLATVKGRAAEETARLVDEFVGLAAERQLTRLVSAIDQSPAAGALATARAASVARILAERARRAALGFGESETSVGTPEERLVYRLGVLKKFVMSVLFLDLARDPGRRAADVAAAGAAALAMFFAVLAAAWAQSSYGVNTTPFVLIIVASYVVKDRIKDWARQFFAARMARWLPDHIVRIREPLSGETLGRCRETVRFMKLADVPPAVRALRYRRTPDALLAGKPETVLHYRKLVHIDSQAHRRTHGPLRDLNDIIRVNIGAFLARADDATRRTLVYDADLDRAAPLDLPKVYHLNVILQMGSPDHTEALSTDRVRVVMDREGIIRLEEPAQIRATATNLETPAA